MSRPRGRMPSERRWAMGKIGRGEHSSTRFSARTWMFEAGFGRSHGRRRPKAHRRVPLDKKVSRRNPTSVGRISGGGLSFGDFSLATQRKVTRPGPKGGRNPVEGRALASHGAQPHQGVNRRLGNSVKIHQGAGETLSRTKSSRSMRRSRIKGLTAGSGIRLESVAVEREFAAVQCAALIAPYGVPLRGEAAPPYQLRERLITLR